MSGLRFEKKGEGNYYKLILHIGDCYVPISDTVAEELTQHASDSSDQFRAVLLDRVGYSPYLKERMEATLDTSNNAATQLTMLQQTLRSP